MRALLRYASQRTEAQAWHGYSAKLYLGGNEMTVIARCNNAGPMGQLIRTRSFASLLARLLRRG